MVKTQHFSLAQWFFLLVSVLTLYIYWQVVEPFVFSLVTAGIFAVVFAPWHKKLVEKFNYPKLSALLILLGIFLIVLVPLFIITVLLVNQANDVAVWSLERIDWLQTFDPRTNTFFVSLPLAVQEHILSIDLVETGKNVAEWIGNRLGNAISGSFALAVNTFIFFISLYTFLTQRDELYRLALELSPFKDSLDENIIARIVLTVRAVVFGALIIAFIQAILATIGLTIFGVPGALFWGALIIIAAQIPSIGVGLIMVPAIAYLVITGHAPSAIGLTIWSVVVVGLIDNILSPILLGARTKMPEVLILISVLGGILAFGPIGFILGPTVLAGVIVLINMYRAGILEGK